MGAGDPSMPIDHGSKGAAISWPRVNGDWHYTAQAWYKSLQVSGQRAFYEQSDVAQAVMACEIITLGFNKQNAALFNQGLAMMDGLLTSVQARRRARIELASAPEAPPSVRAVEKYRGLAVVQPGETA